MQLFLLNKNFAGTKSVPEKISIHSKKIKMSTKATWEPHKAEHGKLDSADRNKLPDNVYAFPKERKEPLTDASHVRDAMARFDQVKDVSDEERKVAFENIKKAAKHYGIHMNEKDWKELAHEK